AQSHCGVDSTTPGFYLVRRRLEQSVPTGSHGTRFNWTVGPGLEPEAFPDTPAVRPVFAPGEALFFYYFNLHRTSWSTGMSGHRHDIECWFFAASLSPAQQIPMLL